MSRFGRLFTRIWRTYRLFRLNPCTICDTWRRSVATQSPGALGYRFGAARRRQPRQLKRVAFVARDHVDVKVKDGLPSWRLTGVEQVNPVRPQPITGKQRGPLRGRRAGLEVERGNFIEVAGVLAGNNECVAARCGADVHESDCPLVLVRHLSRNFAGDD